MAPKRLEKKEFLEVLDRTKLVAIDLVVKDPNERILVGFRVNEPAKGTWFVPGGRIMKDETLEEAFERISEEEIGIKHFISEARLLGPFSHDYENNFYLEPGITTQYIVLAFELRLNNDNKPKNKNQHSAFEWISLEEVDSSKSNIASNIHPNSLAYFRIISQK
jgi:colanic acid biosynthesis protein WcaH